MFGCHCETELEAFFIFHDSGSEASFFHPQSPFSKSQSKLVVPFFL